MFQTTNQNILENHRKSCPFGQNVTLRCHRKQRCNATGAFAPERRPEKPLPLTKQRQRKVPGFKPSKEK